MNAILDIIIVIIAVVTIYFAVKNGFVKTLLSASSFLLAVIITVVLLSPVKTAFMNTSAADNLRTRVESSIDEILVKNGIEDVEQLVEKDSPSDFTQLLNKVGIGENELSTQFKQWKTEAGVDLRERLIDYLAEPEVNTVVTVAAVALLFFGSLILLKIATYVLDKVFTLPVLKTANKLLGVLLGVLLAIVRIYLFCIIIKLLLPYGQTLDIGMLSAINPEGTLLFRLFYDFNIFSFLL
ncbi:MAG: hypothetical protein CVU97_03485 [Firmicutes bacterium HGW-Firmicutes-21]|nr:MAG: hypothetical protein CVU97_03485 [Firmicutes bacterium HGW-Firmicutes-21]